MKKLDAVNVAIAALAMALVAHTSPNRYVNEFIGTAPLPNGQFGFTGNAGDVFPGAATPFGMVQFSPDTTGPGRKKTIPGGYYYPDTQISGFSLDHFSGRGCVYLEDFGFLPLAGATASSPPANPDVIKIGFQHNQEQASPGYYRVNLDNGVRTELTVTPRSGMARFTFPSRDARGTVLVNVTHSVVGALASNVEIIGPREISGWVETKIGCGEGTYRAYFDAVFDRSPATSGVWQGGKTIPGGTSSGGPNAGAYLTFGVSTQRQVLMKVGLSYVSVENARLNRNSENPGWDFDSVHLKSEKLWTTALGRIDVEGGSETRKTVFYTALYHFLIDPSLFDDVNGEYRGFDDRVHQLPKGRHQYSNIAGWDFYRSAAPLLGFLYPHVASDIAQSLINDAQEDKGGGIPRWEQMNRNSNGMVGDGNVPLVANIYAFGARNFDLNAALEAMLRNALVKGTRSDGYEVRENVKDYLQLGWVPQEDENHSAAVTLEYATADFAASRFARSIGDDKAGTELEAHATNWRKLFDRQTGYVQPRDAEGHWIPSKLDSEFGWSEGSTAQYVWMVPFDIPTLAAKMGGLAAASHRLDKLFTELNAGSRSIHYFNGNEPGESTPWLYDFLGDPWKTQGVVRKIQLSLWTNSPAGMPGNADGGALPSWYVFSAIGLYPEVPGVGGFVIGSPMFKTIKIHRGNGQTITIQGINAGPKTPYVKSLAINYQPYHSLWLPLARFDEKQDITLRFELSSHPNRRWGSAPEDAPPVFMTPGEMER